MSGAKSSLPLYTRTFTAWTGTSSPIILTSKYLFQLATPPETASQNKSQDNFLTCLTNPPSIIIFPGYVALNATYVHHDVSVFCEVRPCSLTFQSNLRPLFSDNSFFRSVEIYPHNS